MASASDSTRLPATHVGPVTAAIAAMNTEPDPPRRSVLAAATAILTGTILGTVLHKGTGRDLGFVAQCWIEDARELGMLLIVGPDGEVWSATPMKDDPERAAARQAHWRKMENQPRLMRAVHDAVQRGRRNGGRGMSATTSRRVALGAMLAAPLTTVPALAAPVITPGLLDLVERYEEAEAALDRTYEAAPGCEAAALSEHGHLVDLCGRLRARIALHPAASLADVMLKVRVLRVTRLDDDEADLRATIAYQGGAYDIDLRNAVALDLMRLNDGAMG